jgi:hypothetical protein
MLSSTAIAQTRSELDTIARSREYAIQAQMEYSRHVAKWKEARKLSVLERKQYEPTPPERCLNPAKLTAEAQGLIDWYVFRVQVIDEQNCLLFLEGETTLWLANYPTKDVSDDDLCALVGPVRVLGTEQYKAALGNKRTVRKLEFIPAKEIIDAENRAASLAAKAAQDKEEASYSIWHSKAGTEVEAKFVSYNSANGTIELRTRKNRTIRVMLSDLTDADAERMREAIADYRKRTKVR